MTKLKVKRVLVDERIKKGLVIHTSRLDRGKGVI